jgi:hypothetical protein
MNLPQIPTDNFYKFLNLGGLTLFVSCLMASILFTIKTQEKWDNYLIEIEKNSANDFENIAQKISWERKTDILKGMIQKKYKLKFYPFSPTETDTLKNFKEFYLDFLAYDNANMKIEEFDHKIKSSKANLKQIETETTKNSTTWVKYDATLATLSLLGLVLFVVGGFLWYYQSQRFIDKQLVLESTHGKVFDIKLESAKTFNKMYLECYPKRYWVDSEYDDFLNDIALDFESNLERLTEYQKNYSFVFDNNIIKEIIIASNYCESGRFETEENDIFPTEKGKKTAEKFLKKMTEINTLIKASVSIYT